MQWSAQSMVPAPGLVVVSGQPSQAAEGFARLAESLGVESRWVDCRVDTSLQTLAPERQTGVHALVVDVLGVLGSPPTAIDSVMALLRSADAKVLLLITSTGDRVEHFLRQATQGSISSVTLTAATERSQCLFMQALSGELCGHSFPRSVAPSLRVAAHGGALESILSIDGGTSFGRVIDSGLANEMFVWSTPSVFDVRRPLVNESEFELGLAELLPAVIFLRAALGDRCWHVEYASAAVIIDDPLLRKRYGALDFEKLLNSARQHRYHVTLAFIPWNHWRTRPAAARLFKSFGDVFSVCAHGNDHTFGEFKSDDVEDLCSKLDEAQSRLEAHAAQTGVPHEWLMVFPQELYSVEALRAVARNTRFAAVSNTRCIPDELASGRRLCGADLLQPVADAWFGMPILKRHYLSEGIAKFAVALYLGRPAILATHHQFFGEGARRMEEFVAATRRLSPRVEWQPLTMALRRLCWQRRVGERSWEIRFFSSDFQLGPFNSPRACVLSRRIPSGAIVESVTVNNRRMDFTISEGLLRLELSISERSEAHVKIHMDKNSTARPRSTSSAYRAGVAMRRIGSELRDRFMPGAVEG